MIKEKGTISIHSENIFPIIKKFLYSDHEIFLRELVANAVDATQKLKRISALGEISDDIGKDLAIEVEFNKKKKTITIKDKGIGMTADEIKKYINQIAFSGAEEFLEKYKDKGEEQQIIGFFGLGFYSAFMVSKEVEIITKSYQEGSEAVRWKCDGSTGFEISPAKKKDRGTEIILHIADDSEEFLDEFRLKGILDKHCKFLPIEIKFGTKEEQVPDGKDKEGKEKTKSVKVDNIINNTHPIWVKTPADLKDEDYLAFYKDLYPFSEDPLFWIHLNVDYPFNLTGVLYFPRIKKDIEIQKSKIQLFSRQVFITDEVKDIVPEFLQLLHGVIDSPDIPLNVSRSFLQSDSNVKKINGYITKKVADKLAELFKNDRKAFEEKWDDIGLFVKYGMISEDKFYDKAKDFVLLKNLEGKYFTIDEYKKHIKANQTDKDKNLVYIYTSDPAKQDTFIKSAKKKEYDVLVFDSIIDSHFINQFEQKLDKVQIKRVDAETADKLVDKDDVIASVLSEADEKSVKEVFEKAIADPGMTFAVESQSTDEMPVVITMSEFMRRMKDMSATGGGGGFPMMGGMPDQYNVTINANHSITQKILDAKTSKKKEALARQTFDLALLSQDMLSGNKLSEFIERSVKIIAK